MIAGTGGWMALCTIRCLLMPLNYLGSLIMAVVGFANVRRLMTGSLAPSIYLNMELALLIALAAVLSLVVVVKLFQKDFAFKPLVIALEGVTILVNVLSMVYLSVGTIGQLLRRAGTYGSTMVSAVGMIVVSILFILYYARSDRVKNTFQKSLWPGEPAA